MNGLTSCCTGRIVRDCEVRFTAAGKPVLSASLAVDDAKRTENGETEWVKLIAFGDLADEMAPKLVKGTGVYVEGRMKLSQWNAADGTPRAGLELIAWQITPMGQIGRRRPQPTPEGSNFDANRD